MKDGPALVRDYQANMYAYDEAINYGSLPFGRWVYFASVGKPEARASDYRPDPSIVIETVADLDQMARTLRDLIRQYRVDRSIDSIPPNVSNCTAFGGCPYRSTVGGPCAAEQDTVLPIGSILSGVTRGIVRPRPSDRVDPDFTFRVT